MRDLLSKEHHCYKIHALLMKSSAYSLSIDNPPNMGYPPLLQENLDSPFYENPNPNSFKNPKPL